MKYIISQVSFTGNKGASGMTESLIQNIGKLDSDARFYVLSYYCKSDRKTPLPPDTELLNGSPKHTLFTMPLIPYLWLCRVLHLPKCFLPGRQYRIMRECDLWIDAAGISFVDGREKFTIFNIMSLLPAFAMGIPVVKASQAMGPFHHMLNRLLACIFLKRFRLIVSRGAKTLEYLSPRKLGNVVSYSDVAFSLRFGDAELAAVRHYLPEKDGKPVIGFSPSQVVYKFCRKRGIPYLEILSKCINELSMCGCHCIVFPHSARAGVEKTHNNDLPVLRKLTALLNLNSCITIIQDELTAGQLRALIGETDLLVASRFHAIISAMSTGTPALVIGWSHKYAEVLSPFGLDQYVIPYADLPSCNLPDKINGILQARQIISERIREHYQAILLHNEDFFRLIVNIAYNKD